MFAVMGDLPNTTLVGIDFVFAVLFQRVICPRPFPEPVKKSVGVSTARKVPYTYKELSNTHPRPHSAYCAQLAQCQPYLCVRTSSNRPLVQLTAFEADSFHEVTMFHPNLPFVRWSSVENRLARTNGASYDVEEVIAKARFLVTAAMAEIGLRRSQSMFIVLPAVRTSYDSRIAHGKLRSSSYARLCGTFVHIVLSKSVCQKESSNAALLE
jgi:hypothetical protein